MSVVLENIIAEIDVHFKYVQIDFEDDSWRKAIPAEAGWYLIITNQ